jgi:phage terminase large subunit GpA-like protein
MTTSAPLIPVWGAGLRRPPRFTVSTWADAERVMPDGSRWRTEHVPYLRGVMDAFHDPNLAIVVVQKGNQLGGTEALTNTIGYCAKYAPRRILMAHPTLDLGESYSKDRLELMFRDSPALHGLVAAGRRARAGQRESTVRHKVFPRGWLVIAGANSPASMRQRTADVVMADDADGFPPTAGDEGDPFDLLIRRMVRVSDGKAFIVSTPTLKGGRIDTWYSKSDQRRFFVPCPRCGHMDYITWRDESHFWIRMREKAPETAHLVCPPARGGCGAELGDAERVAMIRAGEYRPTATAILPRTAGFHFWEAYATWRLLSQTAEDFLRAEARGLEALRVWINQARGEPWEERGERLEISALSARRESYGEGAEVPDAAVCLTAFADVQLDRVEVLVMAWGRADERWIVDLRIVPGSIKLPETREALAAVLGARYWHASGRMVPIHAAGVDSGFETDAVYDFVLAHQHRRVYATKGYAGRRGEPIIGKPTRRRVGPARPVRLYPINTDDAKADVVASMQKPLTPDGPTPGALHIPAHVETIDEEFFAQLGAEHPEVRRNKSGIATHRVWVQDRERNEALDLNVGCLAIYRLLRVRYEQWREALLALPVERRSAVPAGAIYDDEEP